MTASTLTSYPNSYRWFFFLVVFFAFWAPTLCQAETINEHRVKAAFFYHFANFVDWPIETFKATQGHLRICVMGKDPFGDLLDEALANRKVKDYPFEIRRNPPVTEITHCHLLYLPATSSSILRTLGRGISKKDILTVGETLEFMKQGGMVQFFIDNKKIRFAINTDVVNQTNLKVSSKLLRLAKIYIP